MALTLQPNFVAKTNSVLPLAQQPGVLGATIRVASLVNDVLGTLTAVGAQGTLSFTLSPETPVWVTGTVDSTGTIFTISFSNPVPNGTIPYEFYVSVTDGVTYLYFPILLDVKPPLSLAVLSGAFAGLTTFTIPSYDSTQADIVIKGIGLSNQPQSGISFIPPASLPAGLEFLTSDGTQAVLHVSDPSPTNIPGGLQSYINTPVSEQVTILAYAPGYFYDEPDRAFAQTFTVQSLIAKQGTLDFMVSVYYDTTNTRFRLDMDTDFLQGQAPPEAINILWQTSGSATGTPTSGSGVTFEWTPATAGDISFTVSLQGAVSNFIYGTKTIGPIAVGPGTGSWQTSAACKISLDKQPGAAIYQGYTGDSVAITVSSPAAEFQLGETITITFAIEEGSALETPITAPSSVPLTSGSPSAVVHIPIPASTIHQKWGLRCVATSTASRDGFAEATLQSNGAKTIVVNNGAILSNTGSAITPYQLTGTDVETFTPVAGVSFQLVGAPDGLNINASNQIVGNALVPGSYTFYVLATASGYANTLSGAFTLTVTQVATPLVLGNPSIVGAVTIPAIEVNNTPFTVQWGYTGTPKTVDGVLFLQSGSLSGPRDVTGATQAATSQPTTSVLGIYGASFYGNAYSIPIIVLSSSIQASQQLLPAPTIGVIDENFNLTLNWQPYIVAGNYAVYLAWDIYVNQPPAVPPMGLQTINGNLPTGLEFPGSTVSNRIYETVLSSGDWTVNMTALTANPIIATNSNPWDANREFPTALTASLVTLSATTLQIGQTLTINLSPLYSGAEYWSVTYPDGTTTGFIPIGPNTRSVATAFNTPGSQNIVIETENDYSTGTPPVKLRRQLTLQVYVTNQVFTPESGPQADLTGTLGIGGTQGFEIVDATTAIITPEPWEVISRSLVRDTVTNELKLMVATSRFASASSLLDTMALDVFPIQGRPLSLDLVEIPPLFGPTPTTSAVPVKVTTNLLPAVIVGKPMTAFAMQASGGIAPYNWYTDSSLPFGLSLTQDGTLFGTPLELGTFNIDFAVQDSSNPASLASTTLPLTIATDLRITTTQAQLTTPQVNVPYTFQIASTGGLPPFAWSIVAGALPLGLSVDPVKGTLGGVPVTYNSTTDFSKIYTFTVQVQDTIGATAQAVYTMSLLPANLQFGVIDQQTVYATEQFKLMVPVFGGNSPYTLTAFTDDGIIGSGLQIVSPTEDTVTLVAGVTPPSLTLTTSPGPTPFFPGALPANISFDLVDFTSGGTAPYNWSITPTAPTTLPQAAIYGSILTGNPQTNGTYTVGVTCVDSIGHVTSGIFNLVVQQQNAPTGSPQYQVFPVAVSFNGTQSNPFNWSVLPITDPPTTGAGRPNIVGGGVAAPFPDAKVGQVWSPQNVDANIFAATSAHTIYQNYQFFGLAVYENGVLHMTQNGAASKVWAALTTFNLGDTILDTNGNLEIVTFAGISGGTEPPVWSTTGGTTTDGSVIWTESTVAVSPPMTFFDVAEDEEPANFPSWLAPQSGTTIAGGVHRDFSGIQVFNVSGGSNPITPAAYSWLTLFTGVVSTNGSLQEAAQRDSLVVTVNGQQAPPTATLPGGTPNIVITFTDVWPTWAPSQGYAVNQEILDLNGNIQRVTAITGTGLTGAAVPSWNKTNSGTTTDNQVTWTNEGFAGGVSINLTTLPPPVLTYPWYVPVVAEGGSGGPYTFQIISAIAGGLAPNPTTLPGATMTTLNSLPAFASSTATAGLYQVMLIASDSIFTTAVWQPTTLYSLGQTILDTNGNIEIITSAGSSGASQPTWGTALGSTKTDNGAVWTNIGVHSSVPFAVNVTLLETETQQVHILNNNLPTGLFGPAPYAGELGRSITPNTYFIQSDLVSNWSATGLPGGVSFTTTPSTRAYLQGTPTANGTFNVTVVATSASYGTQASYNFTIVVTPRAATFRTPLPTKATIGVDYRAANNNALFVVNYIGYQPTDSDLPLLTSLTGTVGAPGVLFGGIPTTQVINLTPNGFTMLFDYLNNTIGSDTVTLKHNSNIFATAPLTIVYPTLVATGTSPAAQTVSEYATTAVFQPPVSIAGGNAPFIIDITGESDPRFVPQNNPGVNATLQITVSQFAAGGTYACQVNTVVTDTEGSPQTSTTTGTVTVTIKQETYITVNYNNQTWAVPASTPNVYYLVLPSGTGFPTSSGPGETVVLGHPPYAFNVTGVVLPGGLTGKVFVSPSSRVIAINTTGSSVNVNDVSSSLTPLGIFSVPDVVAPSPGTYTINISYAVIDAHGISSTGIATVVVVIS
jgi:hypothetical protein